MIGESYSGAWIVPCELLTLYPSELDRAIQNVTRSLVDKVVCELEKGESICSLQTVEQNQLSELRGVEIRRTVKITQLVRCKDCRRKTFYDDGTWWCNEIEREIIDPLWFCAYGEQEVQE